MLSDVENTIHWVGRDMVISDIQIVLAMIGTILIPIGIWFATFTLSRLRTLEITVIALQAKQAEAVTRVEFNDRMDKLQALIIESILTGTARTRLPQQR